MRYVDIRNHVVRVDKTLGVVPTLLLEELMTDLQYMNLSPLLEVEIPGISSLRRCSTTAWCAR